MNLFLAILFASSMASSADIPFEIGVEIYASAEDASVDPYELAAFLVTEHPSLKYPSDSVGDSGEIGLFQIMPMWAHEFGWTDEDLFDWRVNTHVASEILAYALDSHEGCTGTHTWHAHLKAGAAHRERSSTRRAVDAWSCVRGRLEARERVEGCM